MKRAQRYESSKLFKSIARRAPNPYPPGLPCGVSCHFVWCRCEDPPWDAGPRENLRIRALDRAIRDYLESGQALPLNPKRKGH
jgi:hypothetical protein